jgi:predicted RNA-binding protein with PIN domain
VSGPPPREGLTAPTAAHPAHPADSGHWLVDAMNVIGSRPDGWWRDRRGAMDRLLDELAALLERSGAEITVFFDGRPVALEADPGGVQVHFAPGGRNAADLAIVAFLERSPAPSVYRVATSDAALAASVRALGSEVEGAGRFRSRLEGAGGGGPAA